MFCRFCQIKPVSFRNLLQCENLTVPWQRSLFGRKKRTKEEADALVEEVSQRSVQVSEEKHLTKHNLGLLKSHRSLDTKRSYKPPPDVTQRILSVIQTESLVESDDHKWEDISLENPDTKFKVLSKLITEFDHDIPNTELDAMKTVQNAVDFFSTEVRSTSHYEDLSQLDLPKNLNIQLEVERFNPETDTMFGGKTAFPGSDTIVSSIKYKRKYKDIRTRTEKPGYANHYYDY